MVAVVVSVEDPARQPQVVVDMAVALAVALAVAVMVLRPEPVAIPAYRVVASPDRCTRQDSIMACMPQPLVSVIFQAVYVVDVVESGEEVVGRAAMDSWAVIMMCVSRCGYLARWLMAADVAPSGGA